MTDLSSNPNLATDRCCCGKVTWHFWTWLSTSGKPRVGKTQWDSTHCTRAPHTASQAPINVPRSFFLLCWFKDSIPDRLPRLFTSLPHLEDPQKNQVSPQVCALHLSALHWASWCPRTCLFTKWEEKAPLSHLTLPFSTSDSGAATTYSWKWVFASF